MLLSACSVKKAVKSTEQLQMEEIKRLQLEAKKKLKSSRRSYMRLAKGAKPIKVIKGSKPPTEVKEFSFCRPAAGGDKSGPAGGGGAGLQNGMVVHPSNFASTLRSRHASDDCDFSHDVV